MGSQLKPTIVITSKDRCSELRDALRSCLVQQEGTEIIVVNDGSTDGTREMLAAEFPQIRVIHHSTPSGLVAARNEAVRAATGDVVFSIDDDCIFTTKCVVAQTLKHFQHSAIGAVAIPFVDIRKSPDIRQQAPNGDRIWVTDRFSGGAHAVRRNVFVELAGYRDFFVHQGEERDFCMRLLNAGYVVRLSIGDLIHHLESPKRDTTRMDLYGRRNDILFAWLNVPGQILPFQLVGTTLKGLWFGIKVGRPLRMLRGLAMGYGSIVRYWRNRSPVKMSTYRTYRRLQRRTCIDLDELSSSLNENLSGQLT